MTAYDQVFEALGDPTRRAVLERLAQGPSSVGRLAEGLPVSRPAVSQHLKVLRSAGLVTDRQVGTRRIYAIDADGLEAVRQYWDRFWATALERYGALARPTEGESTHGDIG